ncbi:unnamed protein product [Calicophoron daubneyi]|uniref:Protein MON2 homolog n=1 Tax=Calicophoron daubneyi TaxID=300641 RepID=A0AAV2TSX0_CALDB
MPEDKHALFIKLVEGFIQDYKSLVSETRRKYVPIKESAECQIAWLRAKLNSNDDLRQCLLSNSKQLMEPFLNGCLTKQPKIAAICLTAAQKIINWNCLSEAGAEALIQVLWALTDCNFEELRVLQTTILLLTTSAVVRDRMLAKAFSICLRLHLSKTNATVNTAAAAVRQCASAIFDRVVKEGSESPDKLLKPDEVIQMDPGTLNSAAKDAYSLFQDICLLLNDEPARWLVGITDISRTLGLELIESLALSYSGLFQQNVAFAYLLKTNLCPLVIKLFSSNLKARSNSSSTSSGLTEVASAALAAAAAVVTNSSASSSGEKPSFPMLVRLKRLIMVIVEQYFYLLNTECEIYLSLLMRFLDMDKVAWQRALALEVLYKFSAQPKLLRHMCMYYDMRKHSTKIFHELNNTLSQYIQMVLSSPSSSGDYIDLSQQNLAMNPPGPNQSMLYYKGVFFPIIQPKSSLLDLLDRTDAPVLQDGYCLSLAFHCLLRMIRSLETVINETQPNGDRPSSSPSVASSDASTDAPDVNLSKELISLSWYGFLSAFALLLEASADDKLTSDILVALHVMIGLSGKLQVETARDSFVTTLCKAALPGSYARSILPSQSKGKTGSSTLGIQAASTAVHEEVFERSPVVIVVTQGAGHSITITVPSTATVAHGSNPSSGHTSSSTHPSSTAEHAHSPSANGSLLITAKHLQTARAILAMAQVHGNVLGGSWSIVLTTLQNLVWMLGLKIEPAAQLFFKPLPSSATGSAQATPNASTVGRGMNLTAPTSSITSSSTVSNDLTALSAMLSTLFANSSKLSVDALGDLIMGLCQLCSEAVETASANKDPSQFPVAKLTEVGLVNIDRLNLWWDNVCCQLLSMCKLPHTGLRQLAADALVILIKQAIAVPQTPAFWKNEARTTVVLDPLSALSEVTYDDVREKQLECIQHMLHCWGEQIGTSWLRLIEIIGVIRESFKVDLIQTAFQCFKLIVTDYLSSLLPNCYPACVETAARFGQQKQDLNIALTAIGSILHLAGYFLQMEQIPSTLEESEKCPLSLEDLWINIFCKLADLCLDRRATIRKSACQTLFNTVECHSVRFAATTWSDLFWRVLFPLVKNVHQLYATAPVERDGRQNSLLIHHSRDTAAKQWAETVVLTLSGVAHLLTSKHDRLLTLEEFSRIWLTFLHAIQLNALTDSAEICSAAITALQTLLTLQISDTKQSTELWPPAWETWLKIGANAVELRGIEEDLTEVASAAELSTNTVKQGPGTAEEATKETGAMASTSHKLFLPTSSFMALYFDLFVPLFSRIRTNFEASDFTRLVHIVRLGVLSPLYVSYLYPHANTSLLPVIDDGTLSPLQESVIRCIDFLIQSISPADSDLRVHLPQLLHMLLSLAIYAVQIPRPGQSESRLEVVPLNYITFAEKCLQMAVDCYMNVEEWDDSCRAEIFEAIIKTLHKPMALKYACNSQSTWLLASRCFFQVVTAGMSMLTISDSTNGKKFIDSLKREDAAKPPSSIRSLCQEIADTLQDFLFYQQQPPSSLSVEEFQQHEELDCKFVNLISGLFLSSPAQLPDFFISRLVNLLSLGSVQASVVTFESDALSADVEYNLDVDSGSPAATDNWQTRLLSSLRKTDAAPKRSMTKGLGMAVRQTDVHCSGDPLTEGALNLDLDLDRLRQYAFRENFARLCFDKLLSHAFSPTTEPAPSAPTGNGTSSSNSNDDGESFQPTCNVSINVSRAAVRSILQRCRITLIQFYQASRLTGKCPLPRARLAEIAYVFRALTVMLTSLQSVSSQREVDPSTWLHVIEIYPHIVDCVLVTGGSQMTLALHRLLRLYGDLLRPACLSSGSANTETKIVNGT